MSESNKDLIPSKRKGNLAGIGYDGEEAPLDAPRRKGLGGPSMTGEGLFDEVLPVVHQQPQAEETAPIKIPETQLIPRELKFEAETKLFKVIRDSDGQIRIPRTPAQAEDLLDIRLKIPTTLKVAADFLERGVKGGTVIRKVGQSDYGAFTVVLLPVRTREGEEVMEQRLVSFLNRSSRKRL